MDITVGKHVIIKLGGTVGYNAVIQDFVTIYTIKGGGTYRGRAGSRIRDRCAGYSGKKMGCEAIDGEVL